jgi:hypothetical protein
MTESTKPAQAVVSINGDDMEPIQQQSFDSTSRPDGKLQRLPFEVNCACISYINRMVRSGDATIAKQAAADWATLVEVALAPGPSKDAMLEWLAMTEQRARDYRPAPAMPPGVLARVLRKVLRL